MEEEDDKNTEVAIGTKIVISRIQNGNHPQNQKKHSFSANYAIVQATLPRTVVEGSRLPLP